MIKKTARHMLILVALTAAIALISGKKDALPGFFLGAAVSFIYLAQVGFRVRRSGDLPADKAVSYMRTGWIMRLGLIVAMGIVSLKVKQIDFTAAVIGMFTFQIVIMLNAAVTVAKSFLGKHSSL